MANDFFEWGQQAALAEEAGVRESALCEILGRKRRVSFKKALILEKASGNILGKPIKWEEWLRNEITRHPAFRGEPKSDVDRMLS